MMEWVQAHEGYGFTATPEERIFHGAPSVSTTSSLTGPALRTLKKPWGP